MNWTPEIVCDRFLEAAQTEMALPAAGMGKSRLGYWPGYVHSADEMKHWGTKRLAQEREMRVARMQPSSAAVSRFEEVIGWVATMVEGEDRRRLVWAFARCRIAGRSFSAWCRQEKISRPTAYKRLNQVFSEVSERLCRAKVSLQMPELPEVLHKDGNSPMSSLNRAATVEDNEPSKCPTSMILPEGAASDLLKSDEDVRRFAKHVARVNKQRQRMRDRRQRRPMREVQRGVAR